VSATGPTQGRVLFIARTPPDEDDRRLRLT